MIVISQLLKLVGVTVAAVYMDVHMKLPADEIRVDGCYKLNAIRITIPLVKT